MALDRTERQKKLARRVRGVLDPSLLREQRAKDGTQFLLGLSDLELLRVFKWSAFDKQPIEEVVSKLVDKYRLVPERFDSLRLALRRLVLVGIPIVRGLASEKRKHEEQDTEVEVMPEADDKAIRPIEYKPPMEMGPESEFDDVLKDCYASSFGVNGLEEIKFLVELQKRRILRMMRQYARLPNPFLASKLLDSTVEGYRRSLETLISIQQRTGALVPDSVPFESEVRATFDVYQRRFSDPSAPFVKDQMMDAMIKFVEMIQHDYAKLRVSESGLGSDKSSSETGPQQNDGSLRLR